MRSASSWTEALLIGAVVASTDAAAVFFLMHARGLRLRPRVGATLEVESGTNDPFAIFLTIVLVEILLLGGKPWLEIALRAGRARRCSAALIGYVGGRGDRAGAQPARPAAGPARAVRRDRRGGDLRAWPSRCTARAFSPSISPGWSSATAPTRAHNAVVAFLDAATWLAQIVMFVLLGLLAWPERLPQTLLPALAVAATLMLIARPAAVFLCLAPFRFRWREKLFISWVGLRGAVGIFLASIPLLVGLAECPDLFRCRLHRGAGVAAGAGLDHRAGRALAAHRVAAQRSAAAPRRARSAGPARAGDSSAIRSAPTVPICARRCCRPGRGRRWWCATRSMLSPEEAERAARGRLRLSAGAAGKGAGARPLLRRHAAAGARPIRGCSAISSSPAMPRSARWRRSTA